MVDLNNLRDTLAVIAARRAAYAAQETDAHKLAAEHLRRHDELQAEFCRAPWGSRRPRAEVEAHVSQIGDARRAWLRTLEAARDADDADAEEAWRLMQQLRLAEPDAQEAP